MITDATMLVKLLGFIIPTIIILFTFGNIVFSIGELQEKRTNIPKILILAAFKIIIFVLMLDGILYNQLYGFWILSTILVTGAYICFEAIMLNSLLFKIQGEYKLVQKQIKDSKISKEIKKVKPCLNLNDLIYDFWYKKNKFYWITTIILPVIILILNLTDIIVNESLGIFNQGILIYTLLLIFLKHKIICEFKKCKNGRI